ncbi:MAG: cytochrome-c peroxidase, partial [Gemmatimonadetes bacterium]|nr:cytochrome-c peroxidase [Gemmatimonadota bacterium]
MTAGPDLAGAQGTPDYLRPGFQPTPLGLDLYFSVPESNPLTPSKVALGRRLFFDPMLSADRSVACASCHLPDKAFADSVPFSAGARGGTAARNTPSLLNRAYG